MEHIISEDTILELLDRVSRRAIKIESHELLISFLLFRMLFFSFCSYSALWIENIFHVMMNFDRCTVIHKNLSFTEIKSAHYAHYFH